MDERMTEDPGGTADATTEGEDMEVEITATEATEAAGMTTGTQETENPEAGGTPEEHLETGRTDGGTTAAMTGAQATAIGTPEAVARAV